MAQFLDIVDAVREQTGETKGAVIETLRAAFKFIHDKAEDGEAVTIVGFGRFEYRDRSATTAKNPQTGETINVPAKRVFCFKGSKNNTKKA